MEKKCSYDETCQYICFCSWRKWRWFSDRSIYYTSDLLREFWVQSENKEVINWNYVLIVGKCLTNLLMINSCNSFSCHLVSKYCWIYISILLYKAMRKRLLVSFQSCCSLWLPSHPSRCVYLSKLWNDIDLLIETLSAHNPDTVPQWQNSYLLLPVYIIPLWIRARCWHTKLHLSTLLWHFTVTLPKKISSDFHCLRSSYPGNAWHSDSVERNWFLFLIVPFFNSTPWNQLCDII